MAAAILSRFMPGSHGGFMSKRIASPEKLIEQTTIKGMEQPFQDAEGDYDEPLDAEGEIGEDGEEAQPGADPDASDDSPEASEVDGEDDDDDSDVVISRTKRKSVRRSQPAQAVKHEVHDDSEDDSDASDGSASEARADWEAAEDGTSDVEETQADPNRCVYCQQPEDKDPSEDFEEILSCAACGDSAHRQCARDSKEGFADDETDSWRCPDCVDQGVEPEQLRRSRSRRTSSAPRMVRDLLPVVRKPGAHTIFETETYDDKHKTRHKRKASNAASESDGNESRKRRRTSSETVVPPGHTNGNIQHASSRPATPAPRQDAEDGETPKSRSTRLRQRRSDKPLLTMISQAEDQLVVSFNLGATTLDHIREEVRKRKRRERDRARRERRANEQPPAPKIQEQSRFPALESSSSWKALFDMYDREGEQAKTKPYGGILSETEADTTRTFPQFADRKKFESARLKAEEEWRKKVKSATAEQSQSRPSQKAGGQASKVKCIHFGGFEIDTWHASPYPAEYIATNRVLHICEFCLKYMNSDFVAWRHKLKCPARHPPGDEIYHDGTFSFFEVDGRKNPVYCQNLCLLAKLFLGSKTLYLDVEPFLFYVMTENDNEGCHFVGYFSKEKRSSSQNNVSCILVLPIHQRRGFGHMLIDFSYLLTRVEKKIGSPEKPLSDMGLVSYRSYWRLVLCTRLLSQKDALSITSISNETGMTADDVVCALEALRALVRDPVTKSYAIRLDYDFYKEYIDAYEKKGYPKINPKALMWVPYIMGRNNEHYENVQISTVAQREEDLSTLNAEEGVQLAQNDISARDFAAGRPDLSTEHSSSGTSGSQAQRQQSDATPFPELEKTTGIPTTPKTPFANAPSTDKSPIPATRFEVFPPLPGTQKRKAGRPFARGSSRRATPLRRGLSSTSKPSAGARRTRSALAETSNGVVDQDADVEGEEAQQVLGDGNQDQDAEGSKDEQMVNAEGEGMDLGVS